MKQLFILILATAIGASQWALAQGPPSYGYSPPISTSTSGNQLTFHSSNYIYNGSPTYTANYDGFYAVGEGVASYTDFNGSCFAITYDPVAGSGWKNQLLGSSSGNISPRTTGPIAYMETSYSANFAIYDPVRALWQWIGSWAVMSVEAIQENVVLFYDTDHDLNIAIYDPILGSWSVHATNEYDWYDFSVKSNVALFVSGDGSCIGLAYDFEDHTWHEHYFGSSLTAFQRNGGVFAWTRSDGKLYTGLYDYDAHDWINFQTAVPGGNIARVGVNEGTVYYQTSTSLGTYGYNHASRTFEEGKYTEAKCNLVEYHQNTTNRSVSFLTTYAIGGDVSSITSTDGRTILRGYGFKPYLAPGYFAVQAHVSNLVSSSICEHWVYVDRGLAIEESGQTQLTISPNPTSAESGMDIRSSSRIGGVRLMDMLGVTVAEAHPSNPDFHLDLPSGLAAGTYLLEVTLPKGEVVRRKIMLQ